MRYPQEKNWLVFRSYQDSTIWYSSFDSSLCSPIYKFDKDTLTAKKLLVEEHTYWAEMSANGKYLVAVQCDFAQKGGSTFTVFDYTTEKEILQFQQNNIKNSIFKFTVSTDGKKVAYINHDLVTVLL